MQKFMNYIIECGKSQNLIGQSCRTLSTREKPRNSVSTHSRNSSLAKMLSAHGSRSAELLVTCETDCNSTNNTVSRHYDVCHKEPWGVGVGKDHNNGKLKKNESKKVH